MKFIFLQLCVYSIKSTIKNIIFDIHWRRQDFAIGGLFSEINITRKKKVVSVGTACRHSRSDSKKVVGSSLIFSRNNLVEKYYILKFLKHDLDKDWMKIIVILVRNTDRLPLFLCMNNIFQITYQLFYEPKTMLFLLTLTLLFHQKIFRRLNLRVFHFFFLIKKKANH